MDTSSMNTHRRYPEFVPNKPEAHRFWEEHGGFIERNNFNLTRAAAVAGISVQALSQKLKRCGISLKGVRAKMAVERKRTLRRELIADFLSCGGSVSRVAEKRGVPRSTVSSQMESVGLQTKYWTRKWQFVRKIYRKMHSRGLHRVPSDVVIDAALWLFSTLEPDMIEEVVIETRLARRVERLFPLFDPPEG